MTETIIYRTIDIAEEADRNNPRAILEKFKQLPATPRVSLNDFLERNKISDEMRNAVRILASEQQSGPHTTS